MLGGPWGCLFYKCFIGMEIFPCSSFSDASRYLALSSPQRTLPSPRAVALRQWLARHPNRTVTRLPADLRAIVPGGLSVLRVRLKQLRASRRLLACTHSWLGLGTDDGRRRINLFSHFNES